MARAEVHKLMERLAIPAIAAPMFLVSNPALTLACCSEGIMGSFPAHGTRSREEFQAWLDEMQDGMKRLEDSGKKPAPWAVNLVVHPSNPRYPGDLELVGEAAEDLEQGLRSARHAVEIVHLAFVPGALSSQTMAQ